MNRHKSLSSLGASCREPLPPSPALAPSSAAAAAMEAALEALPRLPPPSPAAAAGPSRALARTKAGAFEKWRLDFDMGGPAAVRVSEFADFWPLTTVAGAGGRRPREAYGRPANKRDLGHRCQQCRRPFGVLGAGLVAELQGGGPTPRFHEDCWRRRGEGERPTSLLASRAESCCGSSSSSAIGSSRSSSSTGSSSSRDYSPRCLVADYANDWRRASTDAAAVARQRQLRRLPQRSVLRAARATPVFDGLITVENASGERRLARGFSRQELEHSTSSWACQAESDGECAICLTQAAEPHSSWMRLPCGHRFCTECVTPWLARCGLCPTCRADARKLSSRAGIGGADGPAVARAVLSPLAVAGRAQLTGSAAAAVVAIAAAAGGA